LVERMREKLQEEKNRFEREILGKGQEVEGLKRELEGLRELGRRNAEGNGEKERRMEAMREKVEQLVREN
jgi:hypothetical protein